MQELLSDLNINNNDKRITIIRTNNLVKSNKTNFQEKNMLANFQT